ncbi:MAG: transcriptional regulator [Alphaproteobacteria bacterium CG_4_10_14_0_2_um_filter_63_37]|nr:MAG: transcriptional regulator [Proteobacteria bacterium CG1_02_64_396]PJA24823.1 MAG: transcriptional regulator [Alphaproteobacteria bacterium CG_4_10_14_0_2_um_filter_63_37]
MGVTSVRLQAEIETPLEALAQRLDRSKNYLINQAVREFLERQALEEQRWRETVSAIESVQAGRSVDESAVNEWLESWGSADELKPPSA